MELYVAVMWLLGPILYLRVSDFLRVFSLDFTWSAYSSVVLNYRDYVCHQPGSSYANPRLSAIIARGSISNEWPTV